MVRANEEERSGSISLFDNEEEVFKFKATITYCRYYSDDSTWGVYGFFAAFNLAGLILYMIFGLWKHEENVRDKC